MKKQLMIMATSAGILIGSFSIRGYAAENTYTVQSGDSLWKIANVNSLSVQNVMTYNNLTSTTIYVGQQLILIPPTIQNTTNYTVKSGDSLSVIAKIYNTTVTDLKSINNLTTDLILIGQTLKIPVVQPQQPVPAPLPSQSTYTVKSGDSLFAITQNFHLTVADLKTFNGLVSDTIYVGQVLKVTNSSITPEPKVNPLNSDALITEAKKYIGVPYVWGGSTPSGFDCSGFINYVYNTQGFSVPRTVATLWAAGTTETAPQLGDIVFFGTAGSVPTHAGIYIGNNQFIHAGTSTGVTITDLSNSYWKPLFAGVKRVVQ
ncbi:LysM peptidoglycan-binding domain-containing protein [Neobacillus sp. PS3-40]|uniref:C40 family peptidase n=1 Tax=Neobacillus sp. PS3-40 TaxID=3070679 RepID=UPI0027DFB642|nr:LysM peptidoglycan-binding domain-containing protein [Neobacillus sp. PS3-40]WML44248.1 LysM peptidoglycan-binding domain-containing protein [Neobacillus sp. PS3-40]